MDQHLHHQLFPAVNHPVPLPAESSHQNVNGEIANGAPRPPVEKDPFMRGPSVLENPKTVLAPPTPMIPAAIRPRAWILKDKKSQLTTFPVYGIDSLAPGLVKTLCDQFNAEVERGDSYPHEEPMEVEAFRKYWLCNFAVVALEGQPEDYPDLTVERDWTRLCLGTYYIKPNYPGRSSHVCNAGFMVGTASRGKGVGKIMGESYLDYAPKLGYTYSVFNLVYETNVASMRIWDSLGFKKIGLVPGCGRLKGYSEAVNAVIYGRELSCEEEHIADERFDKIRYYLENGKYPRSADRSEKSRLRSAAAHYRIDGQKLMLKGKEVISDGQRQYKIANEIHAIYHGGINKTTAQIAESYHWVRIKETVSLVIKNCKECKENQRTVGAGPRAVPIDFGKEEDEDEVGAGSPVEEKPTITQLQLRARDSPQIQHIQQRHQELLQMASSPPPQTPYAPSTPAPSTPQPQAQPTPQPQAQPQAQSQAQPQQRNYQFHLIQPHQQAEAARVAAVAAAANIEVPIDPQMMEDVQQTPTGLAPGTSFTPHAATIAAAQAALGDEEGYEKELSRTLQAALRKE